MPMNQFGAGFLLSATDQATPTFEKVDKSFGKMTDGVKKKSSIFDGISKGWKWAATEIGTVMTGAAYKSSEFFDRSVGDSENFEKSLRVAQSVTDKTKMPIDALEKSVLNLSTTFGTSAAEQAQALTQAIMEGFTTAAQQAEIMDAANKLAIGSGTGLVESIEALDNVLDQYAEKGVTARIASDQLFTAAKIGSVNIGSMVRSMGMIAPAAASLGVSFDDLLASITTVASKGVPTMRAIQAIGGVMDTLADPTDKMKDILKKLNVEYGRGALQSAGFGNTLIKLVNAAQKTPGAINDIFGSIRTFNTVSALTSDSGRLFVETLNKIQNATGATDEAFSEISATYSFQKQRFESLMEALRIGVGKSLTRVMLPILEKVNYALKALWEAWNRMPPEMQSSLSVLALSFVKLGGAVGGILVFVGGLGILGVSLSGIVIGTLAAVAAIPLLTLALAGVGTAVFAMFTSLRQNFGTAENFGEVMKRIQLTIRGVAEYVRTGELSQATRNEMEATGAPLEEFVLKIGGWIDKWKAFFSGLKAGFVEGAKALDWTPLTKQFEDFLSVFQSSGDDLSSWQTKGEGVGKSMAEMGQSAIDAASKLVEFGREFAKFIASVKPEDIQNLVNSAKLLGSVLEGILVPIKAIKAVVDGIFDVIDALTQNKFMDMIFGEWGKMPRPEALPGETQAALEAPRSALGMMPKRKLAEMSVTDLASYKKDVLDWMQGRAEPVEGGKTFAGMGVEGMVAWRNEFRDLEKLIAKAVEDGAARGSAAGSELGTSRATLTVNGEKLSTAADAGRSKRLDVLLERGAEGM